MSKKQIPLNALDDFLPTGSYPFVEPFLIDYKVHLTITRSRKTVLGNYRHAHLEKTHRITVNGDLNKFAFLITLLHELAHLVTFIKFGNKVAPHGVEWKHQFGQILKQFLEKNLFPSDIRNQLILSINNPAASSCADLGLMRVLRKYDEVDEGYCLVEEIEEGGVFQINDGRIFKRVKKLRKRIQAIEISTGRMYLFSPIFEVLNRTGS